MTVKCKDACKDFKGKDQVTRCCKVSMMGLGSIFCVGLFGLSIAEIVMGAKYLNDCPKERMIPIYLIVMGAAGILTAFRGNSSSRRMQMRANRKKRCAKKQQPETPAPEGQEKACDPQVEDDVAEAGATCCDCLGGCIVSLFALGWFIAGHVWVFKNQDYNDYITVENGTEITSLYCDSTIYKFAYWSIIGRWIAIGAFLLLAMVVCCGACCMAAAMFHRYEWFENCEEEDEEDCEQPEEKDGEKVKVQDVQLSLDVETAPVKVMALGRMKEGDDPKV